MNKTETVKLLTLVKGNWYRQPTDDLTIAMWEHILKPIEMRDAWEAVMTTARAGAIEVPTAGQIFEAAREYENARGIGKRPISGLLTDRADAPEVRERGKQFFKELREKLERK